MSRDPRAPLIQKDKTDPSAMLVKETSRGRAHGMEMGVALGSSLCTQCWGSSGRF